MEVLWRGTVLGRWVRYFGSKRLRYAEERDSMVITSLTATGQIEELDRREALNVSNSQGSISKPPALENTPLLADGTVDQAEDSLIVDWYGSEDPENPLNWPYFVKVIVTVETCIFTVAIYTGSSLWSVCIDDAVELFGIPNVVAQLGTSLFVLGFGIGPMIFSPLSELASVGRLRVYLWTTILYLLCQLPIPLCNNIEAILVLRFVTGVFCSPCLAVGGGTVADMFDVQSRGSPLSFWELATWGGSAVGPVFAGFAVERHGYKGPMWELVGLAVFALVTLICFLPETMPKKILHQRAQRLRQLHKGKTFFTHGELKDSETSFLAVVRGLFVKAIALNFQEPIVFVLNLYVALVFAIFFGMLESFPYVFKGSSSIYGFSSSEVGLTFIGIFAGGVVSHILYLAFLHFYQVHHFDQDGNITPEERLWPAIYGGICVPIGLFWYGWSAREGIHWIMPIIGGFWFGIGMFGIFMAMLSYLPDAYPSVAATVIAGNCLMRAVLAATFPLFTIQFYEALGPGWASSILGFLGCLFVPYPIMLYRHGRRLRLKSKNARKDI